MVSTDSGVKEVNRGPTSFTSHKVDQNFGGVETPQPEFLGVTRQHDTLHTAVPLN